MSSAVSLFFIVAVAVLSTWSSPSGHFVAEAKHTPTCRQMCNSDSECIRFIAKGSGLTVDMLDLELDTIETLLEKTPSWFGPRPVNLVHKGKLLGPKDERLAKLGVACGDEIRMYKEGDSWQRGEL